MTWKHMWGSWCFWHPDFGVITSVKVRDRDGAFVCDDKAVFSRLEEAKAHAEFLARDVRSVPPRW